MRDTRLKPSFVHASIHDIDYDHLREIGVWYLCFDIDNTLGSMHCMEFDDRTDELLHTLDQRGFQIAFATNSTKDRTALAERYNAILCQPTRINPLNKKPRKPQRAFYDKLLKLLDYPRHRTAAMIGDKLEADVLAAERCGFVSILVNPIGRDLRREDFILFRRFENRRLRQHGIVRAS